MAESASRDRRGLGRGLASLLGDGDVIAATSPGAPWSSSRWTPSRPTPTSRAPRSTPPPSRRWPPRSGRPASCSPWSWRPADAEGHHQLIAGERRWRAAGLAGMERIPAIIREVDARERLELALVENVVREDLSPIDVAQACASLIEDFGQSHGQLAERLGRSRPAISNLVRLLELPEGVQAAIADGALSEGHGRAILMADGPARRTRVAERVVAEGLSVRATEELARRESGAAQAARRPPPAPDAARRRRPGGLRRGVRRPGAGADRRSAGDVTVELRFADEDALLDALARLPR